MKRKLNIFRFDRAAALAAVLLVGAAMPSGAAPEDLDSGFGTSGVSKTTVGSLVINFHPKGNSTAIDSQGRIVVIGRATNSNGDLDYAIVRYSANGSLDTSFGNGGIVLDNLGGGTGTIDEARAVAIDSSDNVVVVGRITFSGGEQDILVRRYSGTNGAVDSTFNNNAGFYQFNVASFEEATAVAIDNNGRIVVAGNGTNPSNSNSTDALVFRLNSNGTLDGTFNGNTGQIYIDPFGIGATDTVGGLAVNSANEIYVQIDIDTGRDDVTFAKLNSSGVLNTGFGAGGFGNFINSTNSFAGDGRTGTGLALSGGKVVVCGQYSHPTKGPRIFVAQWAADGNSFAWVVEEDFGASGEYANDLAIQSDGKIVVVGYSTNGPGVALIRYNADGSRDTSFNNPFGGIADSYSQVGGEDGQGVAIQSDGKIVVGGPSNDGSTFFAARYMGDYKAPETLWETYYRQANETYVYFANRGDQQSGLAFWFYYRAFGDSALRNSQGNAAQAQKEFYRGLAFFYYTYLNGQSGRLYYYYLYLAYSELTYYTALGDSGNAAIYYNFYFALALTFL